MLSPPKPLEEIQPNLVCELLTYMGRATSILLWPSPLGHGEGPKGQISFNFNYKVNFKVFLYQTLCVFSQMKDTKHIRRDFHSVAWVMPQGWGGVPRGKKLFFFKHGHWQIKSTGMTSRTNASKIFILGSNW